MGGKIPRNIKVKVIHQWLDGLTREGIAKKNDIGAGTVTAIIQEARKEEEYNDIDLLRIVAVRLKEEGTRLPLFAFAVRLRRIMEENDIKEDQVEPIIQDFAAYCLRYKIPYDNIIKFGREALDLEQKFAVPIEKIPEYITQGKRTIDRLEAQRLEILRQKQLPREECVTKRQELDTIEHELEKYRKEIPSIQRIIELENELEDARETNKVYEVSERQMTKERDNAMREATALNSEVIELKARRKELTWRLSLCTNELEKIVTDKPQK